MIDAIMIDKDTYYMKIALEEARQAARDGEIPIGAVVVSPRGTILGRGHNLTETLGDVTAHAEMQAITAAAEAIGGKYLTDCTLYVTVEPCLMCAGAIGWAQLSRIVYGAGEEKRGYTSLTAKSPFHPRATVTSGVMAAECASIMKEFFETKRDK